MSKRRKHVAELLSEDSLIDMWERLNSRENSKNPLSITPEELSNISKKMIDSAQFIADPDVVKAFRDRVKANKFAYNGFYIKTKPDDISQWQKKFMQISENWVTVARVREYKCNIATEDRAEYSGAIMLNIEAQFNFSARDSSSINEWKSVPFIDGDGIIHGMPVGVTQDSENGKVRRVALVGMHDVIKQSQQLGII